MDLSQIDLKTFEKLCHSPHKTGWLVEKLEALAWLKDSQKKRYLSALRTLASEKGSRDLYPHLATGHIPTVPAHKVMFDRQRMTALTSFSDSYEKVWPELYKSSKTSLDVKLLVIDEYLKFFARHHLDSYKFLHEKKRRTTPVFLFFDVELNRPNWLPTPDEKDYIDELISTRSKTIQQIRDRVRRSYVPKEKSTPLVQYFSIGYSDANALLNDLFFTIPFKYFIRNVVCSPSSNLTKRQSVALEKIKLRDYGTELFETVNYDPQKSGNETRTQFTKDILFAYFFVCLSFASSKKRYEDLKIPTYNLSREESRARKGPTSL